MNLNLDLNFLSKLLVNSKQLGYKRLYHPKHHPPAKGGPAYHVILNIMPKLNRF